MSAPSSKPSPTTFNERLNEQLINCLNIQTNVIQNLSQYSQHISLQLFEIKNTVEILSNRVLALQQQQQLSQQSHFPPPHYAPPFYPNYMPQQPIPMPPPPVPSHMAPMPFSVSQQPIQKGMPTSMPIATTSNFSLFSTSVSNTSASLSAHIPPFAFSSSAPMTSSQLTTINTLPSITTASTNSLLSNLSKATTVESTIKPLFSFATGNTTNEKPPNTSLFTFGTTNMELLFGNGTLPSNKPTIATTKPETNVDDDGEHEGDDDSYEPNVSFNPIVQLSAVEVKTGEEDENILFCERAKLYRFDSATSQMKERGTGEMKILQHKTTNLCRILMRREQVLKLCANHQITSQMELKTYHGSANAFLWSAMDFSDGEAKPEILCVRFKTDEQAKNFAKVFNEAKAINMKKSNVLPSLGKISLNDDTKQKSPTNDEDVISIGEVKPSAEQIDRAKKLQLPLTFFLYENKEPCKGCAGCEEDTPTITPNENEATLKELIHKDKNDEKISAPQPLPTTATPKTPLSSSENISFSFLDMKSLPSQLQKSTEVLKEEKSSVEISSPTPDTPTQYDSKPSIFGNFNGASVFGSSATFNNTGSSVFGSAPFKTSTSTNSGLFSFPGFDGTSTTTNPNGFQVSSPSITSTTANTASTFSFGSALTNKTIFGNAPKFSFADVAKQSTTMTDDKSTTNGIDQRVFAGQGSLVFGTGSLNISKTGNNHDDEDGDGGADDSYEPNVSFKPIVQLSAVEVKTGEEDENILFCERAKLYRFDPEANQMKERGIGEMKILQHKTTNLCRVLMRREQVLKLCANHQITSQMELKPHQGSDNAFVWCATDFADGEAKHETLCVRFKTSEIAKKFVKQFNEAKQATATNAQQ